MKKAIKYGLIICTCCVLLLTLGLYIYRNLPTGSPTIQNPTSAPIDSKEKLVDINSADLQELMTLPGIGQTFAQRIIDYRNQHGPFTNVTELLNIEGLGTGRLEKLLDHIKIGGSYEDTGR